MSAAEPEEKAPPSKRPPTRDHLKPAAQREAEGEEVATISFEGKEFTFPADANRLPVRALRAIEDGASFKFIEQIITPGEFEQLLRDFRREHGREATARDFEPLMDEVAVALGFKTAGE